MKKLLVTIVCVLMLFSGCSTVADAKLNKKDLAAMKAKLEKLSRIEKAEPIIKVGEIKVVVDQNDRVFVSSTAPVELMLADIHYTGVLKLNTNVMVAPKIKKMNKISMFGLAYGLMPKANDIDTMKQGRLFLTLEPLKYKKVGLEFLANVQFYGAGASYKVSPNGKIIGAAMWDMKIRPSRYNVMPFIGFGMNF